MTTVHRSVRECGPIYERLHRRLVIGERECGPIYERLHRRSVRECGPIYERSQIGERECGPPIYERLHASVNERQPSSAPDTPPTHVGVGVLYACGRESD